jgi:hypothetical protein
VTVAPNPFAIAADLLFPEPSPYLTDPVGWATNRLGEFWWSGQREIAEMVVQNRTVRFLRTMGRTGFTAKDAVTEAVHAWCDGLATRYLGPGEDFPADGGAPSLFGDESEGQERILRPGELSSTPRVASARDVTRISGPVLERARRAVAALRQREDPDLLLMGFVDAAVLRLVDEVEARYPELSRHAEGLPENVAGED